MRKVYLGKMKSSDPFPKFAYSTSIHGIQYAYESQNKFAKFLWILLFLFMFISASVCSFKVVERFFDNPVYVMSYSTNEKEKRIVVPDLVFCFGISNRTRKPSAPRNKP